MVRKMRKPSFKKREVPTVSPRRLVNIIPPGTEYGDWTVKGLGEKKDYLKCVCVCGVEREVHVYSLRSNKSVSCGCRRLKKESV